MSEGAVSRSCLPFAANVMLGLDINGRWAQRTWERQEKTYFTVPFKIWR